MMVEYKPKVRTLSSLFLGEYFMLPSSDSIYMKGKVVDDLEPPHYYYDLMGGSATISVGNAPGKSQVIPVRIEKVVVVDKV